MQSSSCLKIHPPSLILLFFLLLLLLFSFLLSPSLPPSLSLSPEKPTYIHQASTHPFPYSPPFLQVDACSLLQKQHFISAPRLPALRGLTVPSQTGRLSVALRAPIALMSPASPSSSIQSTQSLLLAVCTLGNSNFWLCNANSRIV